MKFGKNLQQQQLPGWAPYYINYKALKKIISGLEKQATLSPQSSSVAPSHNTSQDSTPMTNLLDDPVQSIRSGKATFFFKLERELEKVNAFYLQKEAERRIRLRSLIEKKALLQRRTGKPPKNSASLIALQEAFQQFIKDLNKLQQFVELNATGFRKILKKWDKRSKSNTKELYLSRQVEKTPCFDREVITELADAAASNLVELENYVQHNTHSDDSAVEEIKLDGKKLTFQTAASGEDNQLDELEADLIRAVSVGARTDLRGLLEHMQKHPGTENRERISRVFATCLSDAPDETLDQILELKLVDFAYVEDINDRTIVHEAAIAGRLKYVKLGFENGVDPDAADVGGRTALHYACMNGHDACAEYLLSVGRSLDALDNDNSTPLIYAVTNGHANCVKVLLNAGAKVTPQNDGDYVPLALACQYGHRAIAEQLIAKGALDQYDQSSTLSPLHLAAREGHAEVCELLCKPEYGLLERVDKDTGWTAVFYAASEGHVKCLKLLTLAKAKVNLVDESRHSPLYYAAWEGHTHCIQVLKDAGVRLSIDSPIPLAMASENLPSLSNSPAILNDFDIDTIPNLSLPPPIIPFRIYGHSYLEKKDYVQLIIGHRSSNVKSAVKLYGQSSQLSSLKMVISSKHDLSAIPHNVILPLADEREVFSFQVNSLDTFVLEFDVYPTFGSRIIGKAVALPHMFDVNCRFGHGNNMNGNGGYCTLPLLDTHLNVVGEVSFEFTVVKPFTGVQLQVGGRIETYWKSTDTIMGPSGAPTSSPSSVPAFVTASSLTGAHIHLKVQVTRDCCAVIYSEWRLLGNSPISVAVSEVTYEQFKQLTWKDAQRSDRYDFGNPKELQTVASMSCGLLGDVLEALPSNIGVHLEILYPSRADAQSRDLAPIDINRFVDTILHDVYNHASVSKKSQKNRSIVFSSFNPDVCTTLNWKQPNYAVFFKSICGKQVDAISQIQDKRSQSIKEAVKFATANNLLGVHLDATLLVQVPSLIKSVKESGLFLTTFGEANSIGRNRQIQEQYGVDAIMNEAVITYGIR